MPDRDDLAGRLAQMGATELDGLDDARRDAILQRVVDRVTADGGARRRSRRLVPVLVAAAASLVVAGLLLAGARRPGVAELDAFAGVVSIEMPSGAVSGVAVGIELPDGTTVVVGPDSSATIDGRAVGPGRYRIVGRVPVLDPLARPIGPSVADPSIDERPMEPTTTTTEAPLSDRDASVRTTTGRATTTAPNRDTGAPPTTAVGDVIAVTTTPARPTTEPSRTTTTVDDTTSTTTASSTRSSTTGTTVTRRTTTTTTTTTTATTTTTTAPTRP